MLTEIGPHNLPPFLKLLPGKLKVIRERLGLKPDEIAPKVGAKTGAEILAYENDEDDLLLPVPVENLARDLCGSGSTGN